MHLDPSELPQHTVRRRSPLERGHAPSLLHKRRGARLECLGAPALARKHGADVTDPLGR